MSHPIINVGDLLTLRGDDYLHGHDPAQPGTTELRVRVKHHPGNPSVLTRDWIPLIGTEILPTGTDGPDRALIVRRTALPHSTTEPNQ